MPSMDGPLQQDTRSIGHRLSRPPTDSGLLTTLLIALSVMCLFWTSLTMAQPLPAPTEATVLIIKGDMQHSNINDEAHFDMNMLRKLPRTEFTTTTPWDEGAQSFAGVRVSDILNLIGAQSQDFKAIGVDDYKFDVTNIAFDRFPIIIAYENNGKAISVRKLGPLRLIFPVSDFPELSTEKNQASAVWQLVEMQLL